MSASAKITAERIRFTGFASFEKAFITLSNGREEELAPSTLFYENQTLYCKTERGIAAFASSPAIEILSRLKEENGEYSVTVAGASVKLKPSESKS